MTLERHMNKSLKTVQRLLLCLVFLFFTLNNDSIAASDREGSLEELVRITLEQNNEILSAESRVVEATEKIRQAGSMPDPQLGFEYFLEPIETRTGPQEASVSLKQSVPWPGRLSLDKNLKEKEAEIARAFLIKTRSRI